MVLPEWKALLVSILVIFGASSALADHDDDDDDDDERGGGYQFFAAAKNTPASSADQLAWKEECGSCHVPFPAKRLPAASWQKIMGNLADHYGTDATIDDAQLTARISSFLKNNAGDPSRYRDLKGAAVPMRMTETQWFVREHDEVGANVWKRPSIKTPTNCGACHQRAAEGEFRERDIRIPKQ